MTYTTSGLRRVLHRGPQWGIQRWRVCPQTRAAPTLPPTPPPPRPPHTAPQVLTDRWGVGRIRTGCSPPPPPRAHVGGCMEGWGAGVRVPAHWMGWFCFEGSRFRTAGAHGQFGMRREKRALHVAGAGPTIASGGFHWNGVGGGGNAIWNAISPLSPRAGGGEACRQNGSGRLLAVVNAGRVIRRGTEAGGGWGLQAQPTGQPALPPPLQ